MSHGLMLQTHNGDPILDAGTTLSQHWVTVSCLLAMYVSQPEAKQIKTPTNFQL